MIRPATFMFQDERKRPPEIAVHIAPVIVALEGSAGNEDAAKMRISRLAKAAVFRLRNRHLFNDDLQALRLRHSSDYFEGKSVALIGNAQSIFDQVNGAIIDAHDVVVRLNRGSIRDAASQGSRTDALCIANPMSSAEIGDLFGKPRIIWVTPKRELMDPSLVKETPCYPIANWRCLSALLNGRRPSAGLITLFMLRETFAPAAISLFGFDWKASKTFYHDQNNMHSWHDWKAEQELVAAWLGADPRLALGPSDFHLSTSARTADSGRSTRPAGTS